MEGWLEVPPERNLIGRAAWKPRYVRLAYGPPLTAPAAAGSRTSIVTPLSPGSARPVTAGGSAIVEPSGSAGHKKPLERSQSTHQVSAMAAAAVAAEQRVVSGNWSLAVYKQKGDTEPVARYPLHTIASCYIGDVASRKKKSAIQPTLVVHLRQPDPLSYPSSVRSFRRRSQDAMPKLEALRRDSSASSASTLMFRPTADDPQSLERWVREIQPRLTTVRTASLSKHATTGSVNESAFREKFADSDTFSSYYDSPVPSPSSLFLVNGEPSTALLSPSIRSRASNLSSIESDEKASMLSSSTSELISPTAGRDDKRSPSSLSDRFRLNLATDPYGFDSTAALTPVPTRETITDPLLDAEATDSVPNLIEPLPQRRETILDRFFSISASPPSTQFSEPESQLSSLARFEALMRDLETCGNPRLETPSLPVMMHDSPRRIPSPTQRALEFVLTGQRPAADSSHLSSSTLTTAGDLRPPLSLGGLRPSQGSAASSRRSSAAAPLTPAPFRRYSDEASAVPSDGSRSNRGSWNDAATSGSGGEWRGHSKRHSLADFSGLARGGGSPVSPTYGIVSGGGGRRGSYGDIKGEKGCASDAEVTKPVLGDGEFGDDRAQHRRVGSRALFREFSF